MIKTIHFLYLEAHPEDVTRFRESLAHEHLPCEVTWVRGTEAFESALAGAWRYDLIFVEAQLQTEALLAAARLSCPEVPVILMAAGLDEAQLVAYLKQGARDYLLKPGLARLGPVLRRALEEVRMAAARSAAEASSQRAVALLRATLEATSEGVLVVDLAGKITSYNRKFMTLCGIPEYVMAPMELERVLQFLLDQFLDPEAFLAEVRLLGAQPDRESFGLLAFKNDLVLEEHSRPHQIDHRAVGRIYTFSDVTAREQARQRNAGLGSEAQQLLEATAAGGVVPWCLTEDNLLVAEQIKTVLGLAGQDLPRDLVELEALIHPEELDRFRLALEQPQLGTFELRMRKGHGWIWTRWFLKRDRVAGYRGVFLDISAQRRQEETFAEQRRAQGMAALAENSTRILETLLKAAQSPLDQLRREAALAGPQQTALQIAVDNLDGMALLLTELETALRCHPDPGAGLDLRVMANTLVAEASKTLGAGITLKVDLAPGLPSLFMSDQHLQQVIRCLLGNAKEAQQGSGTIRLRIGTGQGKATCAGCEGCLSLEVEDHGPGIPAAVQSRMFEPFFTTRKGANGLGLTLVRSIVDSYQGSIQVDSVAGRGTTMRVLLPAVSVALSAAI